MNVNYAFNCFDSTGFFANGVGGYCSHDTSDRRLWATSVALPHVVFGSTFSHLRATAVCDDFGTLVLIGDWAGKVVLS